MSGDAVDIVARLKAESDVPLRSQGSLSLNWALMAAGLVDRLQVTIFPATCGRTGTSPVLGGEADSDLETAGEPDARRSHPRGHLPTEPPLTRSKPNDLTPRWSACHARGMVGEP